jgi:hypothetical protein
MYQDHNPDYVIWWWQRGEFSEQRGDWQATSCLEIPGADLLQDASSESALSQAPLGEPPVAFDVRSTYDSRPVNSYDFNFSQSIAYVAAGGTLQFSFNVPQGYRAVPREWSVLLTAPALASSGNFNQISLNSNGAAVPNNQNIIFGAGGTEDPIKSFFLCEEQTQFGATVLVQPVAVSGQAILNVYGNLIPVTSVALPFAIANETKFNPSVGTHA